MNPNPDSPDRVNPLAVQRRRRSPALIRRATAPFGGRNEMAMRLPLLSPDKLSPEQKALYDRARGQIARDFTAFKTTNENGALLGPWGVFLHEPAVGQAHYDQVAAVTAMKRLDAAPMQVAILVIGARFRAAYELYAHAAIAIDEGLNAAKVATIAAGKRPVDLTADEACAYDVASALAAGGVLPDATYKTATTRLGQEALNELVFWVGLFAQISITLNAFNVPSEARYDQMQST